MTGCRHQVRWPRYCERGGSLVAVRRVDTLRVATRLCGADFNPQPSELTPEVPRANETSTQEKLIPIAQAPSIRLIEFNDRVSAGRV